MTLDSLPILSENVLRSHQARLRNEVEYKSWLIKTDRTIRTENPVLYNLIEVYANNSDDPKLVRGVSYTLLTLIAHQIEADKMNREERK